MILSKRSSIILSLVGVSFIIGLVFGAASGMRNHEPDGLASLYRNATVLVSAISTYRIDEGVYPDRLSNLAPAYVDVIPFPEWGDNKWTYAVHGDSFALKVMEDPDEYPSITFYSETNEWYHDD